MIVTAPKAAETLGVSKYTVYRWLWNGFVIGEQLTPGSAVAPPHRSIGSRPDPI